MPVERTRALIFAGELLADLLKSAKTSHVPEEVQERARHALRHYPTRYEIAAIARDAERGAVVGSLLEVNAGEEGAVNDE